MEISIEQIHEGLLEGYRGRGEGKTLNGLMVAIQSALALDRLADLKIFVSHPREMRYMYDICFDIANHLGLDFRYKRVYMEITLSEYGKDCLRISPWLGDVDKIQGYRPLVVYFDGHYEHKKQVKDVVSVRSTQSISIHDSLILIQE